MPRRVLLDTDTGVDDALAICLAVRSPELQIEAITVVHGNVPVGVGAANVQCTLDVLRASPRPPVSIGAACPLVGEPTFADDVHGRDGLGGATRILEANGGPRYPESDASFDPRPAAYQIHDCIAASETPLTVIAVGPLTNIALAIQSFPGRMQQVQRIVIMGGCFRRAGNASPVAEFNIWSDPFAAQIVFDSGIPITLIPLDVTEQVCLTRELVELYKEHRLGRFIADVTAEYMDFGRRVEGADGCFIHDPLAVMYVLRPELFRTIERQVQVERFGEHTRGQTIADLREPPRFQAMPNAQIALEVDAGGALDLFTSRVLRP